MPVLRRLHKQGSSTVCTIPGWMMEQCGMKHGSMVQVSLTTRREIKLSLHSQPGVTPSMPL